MKPETLPNALSKLLEKLHLVQTTLNSHVLERDEETEGILLAVLASSSALFFGEPGTAKTAHINLAAQLLGLSNFDILMSETVKPDAIFGPTDIPALAQGKQQTKWEGYAPDCEILFFDEIFKANATVLNPLLWLINEHKFRDGDNGIRPSKTMAVFAASNELPQDSTLAAVYDRFLLRYNVRYLQSDDNVRHLISNSTFDLSALKPILTRSEIVTLRNLVPTVQISDDMKGLAINVRRLVEYSLSIKISDRRFIKAMRLAQASALLRGRLHAETQDFDVLAHVFWHDPNQKEKVSSLVYANTSGDIAEISTYMERAHEIKGLVTSGGQKLPVFLKELKGLYRLALSFKSRYAKQCADEIKSIGMMVQHIIRQRKVFSLVSIRSTDDPSVVKTYKVAQSTAAVYSVTELRTLGFRYRRKSGYWYIDTLPQLQAKCEKRGITLNVSAMGGTI